MTDKFAMVYVWIDLVTGRNSRRREASVSNVSLGKGARLLSPR